MIEKVTKEMQRFMFCFDVLLNASTLGGSDQTHLLILHVGGIAIDLERTVRDSTPQG